MKDTSNICISEICKPFKPRRDVAPILRTGVTDSNRFGNPRCQNYYGI